MKTKTLALTAVAALALPAAAQAGKPNDPGKHGRDKAAQKQSATKTQKVGFTFAGLIGATGAPDAAPVAGTEFFTLTTDPFSLDLESANLHARKALGITSAAFEGTTLTAIDEGSTTDRFRLTLVGFDEGEAPDAGDRVKVIGKVTRTRNAKGSQTKWTYGDIDVRKVVVTDAPDVAPTA